MSRGDEQAFPVYFIQPQGTDGMTLREYYAGLAMQGILAGLQGSAIYYPEGDATQAILYADALLAALEAKKP